MRRLSKLLRSSQVFAKDSLPLFVVMLVLPSLVLMGFGLIAIYQLGYLLHFVLLLTLISVIYFTLLLIIQHRLKKQLVPEQNTITDTADTLVEANQDWNEFDLQIWHQLNQTMDALLKEKDSWEILREHAYALVAATAQHYRPNKKDGELAITLPELLSMTEEISRRYRAIILEHLPFAEQLHISRMKQFYQLREKSEHIEQIWQAYRAFRLFTPTGIISEIRSQIAGHLLDEVKDELSLSLKKAFLQEVASVAIDLYSGRFQYATNGPTEDKLDETLPPLRICIIGQVNAGKSSLCNFLLSEIKAETNSLPSTDRKHVYALCLEEKPIIHLIDLPGLDGDQENELMILKEVAKADILLWVLKATQPARALDVGFKQSIEQLFQREKMRSRKPPIVLGVVTHVDQLSLLKNWQPPYSWQQPVTEADQQIHDALEYNQNLLKLDIVQPVAMAKEKETFGLEDLMKQLDSCYQDARQVQLNRMRLSTDHTLSVKKELKRAYHIGRSLFSRWQSGR